MGYIYKITNRTDNKQYVGQTTKARPTDRFSQHKYLATHPEKETSPSYLHRAMYKDGVENFSFEIIEEVNNDKLNDREKYWIQQLNTYVPNGYNLTIGGDGTPGYARIQSEDEKKHKSEIMKQYFIDHPEKKDEIRARTTMLWQNQEYRDKVTNSNKEFYKNHPDKFKGENNPFYGKHHTEESLQKIREASAKRKIKIAQLNKDTLEIIQVFDGIKDAEAALKVSHGWLSKAARQNKVAYGYRWKFM